MATNVSRRISPAEKDVNTMTTKDLKGRAGDELQISVSARGRFLQLLALAVIAAAGATIVLRFVM